MAERLLSLMVDEVSLLVAVFDLSWSQVDAGQVWICCCLSLTTAARAAFTFPWRKGH